MEMIALEYTVGQDNKTIFRKIKSLHFYHYGDFVQKLVKIIKVLKDFISGKIYFKLAPVWNIEPGKELPSFNQDLP